MEDELKTAIEEDLKAVNSDAKENVLNSFEKMSKANLAKQDKKLLLEFAEKKGVLKGLTDRQKERLNRKELAELIKPTQKRTETHQKSTKSENMGNDFQEYQIAFMMALNGDYAKTDYLAQKNITELVSETANSSEEMSEKAKKIIKAVKFGGSVFYMLVRATGGFKAWKDRIIATTTKIKEKIKAKNKNV